MSEEQVAEIKTKVRELNELLKKHKGCGMIAISLEGNETHGHEVHIEGDGVELVTMFAMASVSHPALNALFKTVVEFVPTIDKEDTENILKETHVVDESR